MWSSQSVTHSYESHLALYACLLPKDNEVRYANILDQYTYPNVYYGDFSSFRSSQDPQTPIVIVDMLTAHSVGWITTKRLCDNLPIASETLAAALRLATGVDNDG